MPAGLSRRATSGRRALLLLALAGGTAGAAGEPPADPALLARGEYLVAAGGCISCHTADEPDAVPLAGGLALETGFGIFWSPNITPDAETGIGSFTVEDIVRALRKGVAPDGGFYYPAFPYPSYAGMTEADAEAIAVYLKSLPPVKGMRREHELPWYLTSRLVMWGWNLLNFRDGQFVPDPERPADWNRGAYLVRHLGHCGECHTRRTILGGLDRDAELAGNPVGIDGDEVPNITPHREDGIGTWSEADLLMFLEVGMLPDGDFAGAGMGEVIDDNTGRLTPEDRAAIVTYLSSLPPTPTPAP